MLFLIWYLTNLSSIKIPIETDKQIAQNSNIARFAKLFVKISFAKQQNKPKEITPKTTEKTFLLFKFTLTNLKII